MAEFVNAGARLDRLPMTRYHRWLITLVTLGLICDTYDIGVQGAVLAALLGNHFSTFALNSYFVSATFVGMTIGAAMAGILGDKFGRRFSYQFNLLVFGLGSLAAASAPTMTWLIALRAIAGVGLGAELVIGYGLVSEFVPPANRGRIMSYVAFGGVGIAGPLVYITSFFVIPSLGWRWMFVFPAVGALIIWYLRKDIPESPRWLEAMNRKEEAEKVLQAIEAAASRLGPLPPPATMQPVPAINPPLSALFGSAMINRTLIIVLTNIAAGVAMYGFVVLIPTFLVKQGVSVGQTLSFSMIMSWGFTAGVAVSWLLADRAGRKWVIVGALVATAVTCLVYPHASTPDFLMAVGFLLIACVGTLLTMGIAIYGPELFPTEIRLRGSGIGQVAGRAAAIGAPLAALALYNAGGLSAVTGAIAGVLVLVAAYLAVFGLETRLKPLEAIENPLVSQSARVELVSAAAPAAGGGR